MFSSFSVDFTEFYTFFVPYKSYFVCFFANVKHILLVFQLFFAQFVMTPLVIDDLSKVCRGCLGKNGEMRPLFGSFLDNMLCAVAEIEVRAGDGLPELMCVPCVLQVSRAFTFKQLCQRSDQTLRYFFQCNGKSLQSNDGKIESSTTNSSLLPLSNECENQTNDDLENDELDLEKAALSMLEASQSNNSYDVHFADANEASDDQQHQDNKCMLIVSGSDIDPDQLVEQISLDTSNVSDLHDDSVSYSTSDELLSNQLLNSHNIPSTHEPSSDQTDDVINIDEVANNFVTELTAENPMSESSSVDIKIESNAIEESMKNACDLLTNSSKKSFECPECHKIFAESKILNRHLKIHNPIKKHKCNECDMTFAESSNLTKHLKKHTGELRNVVGKPNLCAVCGKGFKWASSLSKHMKHHTGHRILTCPYCPKYYVEARSLNIHLRSHTGEKPFVCDICQKAFTQMGNLEKHLRVHTGERPYKCPMCGKGFSQSGYVTIHLRTHTGERPYTCPDCGKAFAGSNTLAIHRRTHTGERPYPCSMCDKTFARHETAIIHLRTHTGEKPHICQICQRGFTSSGHLTGHMRSHRGIKTHSCNVCHKRFAGSSSLKVHMKTHNDNSLQTMTTTTTTTEVISAVEEKQMIEQYECNMCKQNIPLTALKSSEELHAYEHEIIDNVLICSKVDSMIEHTKFVDAMPDDGSASILLTESDLIDADGQGVIISLADLK